MIQEMEGSVTSITTVIAKYCGHFVLVLFRHWISLKIFIQLLPTMGHVSERFQTDRAPVVLLSVFIQTRQMNVVTTLQNAHGFDRCEHVLSTNWAITMQCILQTNMVIKDTDIDT